MSENANIPEGSVKMTITTPHYRRSVNGAWMGNGASSREIVVTFEEARRHSFYSGSVFFEYRDGTCESLDLDNTPCRFFSSDPQACTEKRSRALGKIGYYGPGRLADIRDDV